MGALDLMMIVIVISIIYVILKIAVLADSYNRPINKEKEQKPRRDKDGRIVGYYN